MSPTSYQAAPPRDAITSRSARSVKRRFSRNTSASRGRGSAEKTRRSPSTRRVRGEEELGDGEAVEAHPDREEQQRPPERAGFRVADGDAADERGQDVGGELLRQPVEAEDAGDGDHRGGEDHEDARRDREPGEGARLGDGAA